MTEPAIRGDADAKAAAFERRISEPAALYVHIPFCEQRCHYCDFNTFAVQGQPVDDYLAALEREMETVVRERPPGVIRSVYIGGGTPTILDAGRLSRLLIAIRRHFPDWAPDCEVTVEANPGTADPDKLAALKEGGVNRLSFGVQAFDDALLKAIGRIHDTADVYRSIAWAREAGFSNLSIDLMFGLPNQTLDHVRDSVRRALELDLPHYSLYSLKIEERTLFDAMYERNELPLPDEDTELDMYTHIIRELRASGYRHYEISNFAKPGYEGRHNIAYWRNESYYGVGAGAHGYVDGIRHVNIKGVREYIAATSSGRPVLERHPVDDREAMEDFMMVGLRLLDGVSGADFAAMFGKEMEAVFGRELAELQRRGLLEKANGRYRLTWQGLLLGNEVFGEFVGVL